MIGRSSVAFDLEGDGVSMREMDEKSITVYIMVVVL